MCGRYESYGSYESRGHIIVTKYLFMGGNTFAKIGLTLGLLGGCATTEQPVKQREVKPAASTAVKRAMADRDNLLAHCSRELLSVVDDCAKFGKRCEVAFPNSGDANPHFLQQLSSNVAFGCKATLDSNALRDSMKEYEEGLNSDTKQEPCTDASKIGQCIK